MLGAIKALDARHADTAAWRAGGDSNWGRWPRPALIPSALPLPSTIMATQAVCKAQAAVVGALARTSAARPTAHSAVLAPMHVGKAQVFVPKRPMGVRSRAMTTVTAAANGSGLPIDLRGEACPARPAACFGM